MTIVLLVLLCGAVAPAPCSYLFNERRWLGEMSENFYALMAHACRRLSPPHLDSRTMIANAVVSSWRFHAVLPGGRSWEGVAMRGLILLAGLLSMLLVFTPPALQAAQPGIEIVAGDRSVTLSRSELLQREDLTTIIPRDVTYKRPMTYRRCHWPRCCARLR
jgi:hypothetical protein